VRGSLTVVESGQGIPFAIARIFYIYGATRDCERGAHAHYDTQQAFVAIRGRFSLELTDGHRSQKYVLDRPDRVLYVPPMIWARLYDFSDDAVCLVLASSLYDPDDYIREWDDYLVALGLKEQAEGVIE
jgi:dTDP-4-dehydrorhamnose 3,5-epimerase-like enzyme